jgi:transposase
MNLQLHKALSDITGVTGMKILRAILAGERDAVALAKLKHPGVKSSEEDLAKALTGEYRDEQLFVLRQAMAAYDFFHEQIASLDEEIRSYLKTLEPAEPRPAAAPPAKKKKQSKRRKNQPHFDLRSELIRITGVDLCAIDGLDAMTVFTILTEGGSDMSLFPTDKHYTSWLALSPRNEITGGKVRNRRTRRSSNPAAKAYRLGAQSLHKSQTALGAQFRRLRARLGAPKAITAMARRLAVLVYRMLKFGQAYVDQGQEAYERQFHAQQLTRLQKQAKTLGFSLVPQPQQELPLQAVS